MITHRLLPPEEWSKLLAFEPFRSCGLPESPINWRICVAEHDGEIVGHCCIFSAVHWDMWQIHPAYQKNPNVVKGLIKTGTDVLKEADVAGVFAVVDKEQPESHHRLMTHFGFQPAPGALYLLDMANLLEVD